MAQDIGCDVKLRIPIPRQNWNAKLQFYPYDFVQINS